MNIKQMLIYVLLLWGVWIVSMLSEMNITLSLPFTKTMLVMSVLFVVLSPFDFQKYLFHKAKGVSGVLLPVSNMEKYLTILLLSAVVLPLVLAVGFYVFYIGIGYMKGLDMLTMVFPGWRQGGVFYLSVLAALSVSVWGVCFFRTQKLWKTVATMVCIGMGFLIILFLLAKGFFIWDISTWNFHLEDSVKQILEKIILALQWLVPIGIYVAAFFRFRKQQC